MVSQVTTQYRTAAKIQTGLNHSLVAEIQDGVISFQSYLTDQVTESTVSDVLM